MNLFSILFIGVILVLACITATRFIFVIASNFNAGQHVRKRLLSQIKMLRLEKMLGKRKIDMQTYLHRSPIHRIENQIRHCESCREIALCDEVLSPDNKLVTNFSFCPNAEAFNELIQDKKRINKTLY